MSDVWPTSRSRPGRMLAGQAGGGWEKESTGRFDMEASFNAQDLRLPVFTYVIQSVDTRWRSEGKLTASNTGRSKQIEKRSQRDTAEATAITCERTQLTINSQRGARSRQDCCMKVSVQAFLVSYFLPVFPPFSATSRTNGLAARAIQDPQLLRTTADGSSGSKA
jgi:hypothetical protein